MTQKVVTLSSGEAELSGVVKGAGEGIGMQSIGKDLGIDFELTVLADSSAAIGICRRTGIGRVRHLAVGQLWVQERVRCGDLVLRKHPGQDNPADRLTKHVDKKTAEKHIDVVNMKVESGRPHSAPRVS